MDGIGRRRFTSLAMWSLLQLDCQAAADLGFAHESPKQDPDQRPLLGPPCRLGLGNTEMRLFNGPFLFTLVHHNVVSSADALRPAPGGPYPPP